jgi:hypothetical protein
MPPFALPRVITSAQAQTALWSVFGSIIFIFITEENRN